MDTAKILAELRGEQDRIGRAIDALEALDGTPMTRRSPGRPKSVAASAAKLDTTPGKRRKSGLTAAGRKRLSENMKRRWAERRKNAKPKARAATV